jgi:hypothetical protein
VVEAEVWPPLEVVTFKRTPFREQVDISVSIETLPVRVVTAAPVEIITFKRVPFYERAMVGVPVVQPFEEAVDCSLEVWEQFTAWTPFDEAAYFEGYVFSDMEMVEDVRYIKRVVRQIRAVVVANGLAEEENLIPLTV